MENRTFYCRYCNKPTECEIIREYHHRLSIKVLAKCTKCKQTFDGRIAKPLVADVVTEIKVKHKTVRLR